MKMQFQILKDRPKLKVRVTRDSVCAGDDCNAPHEKVILIHSFTDPVALASNISTSYLPNVNGIGHTWDCILNGNKIAEIRTSGIEPSVHEVTFCENNEIHFVYHSARY